MIISEFELVQFFVTADKFGFVQNQGALAVIIAAAKGQDVTLINCEGEECSWPLSIAATMISHKAGQQIQVTIAACLPDV